MAGVFAIKDGLLSGAVSWVAAISALLGMFVTSSDPQIAFGAGFDFQWRYGWSGIRIIFMDTKTAADMHVPKTGQRVKRQEF
jgi:hypothetical protein